MQEPNPNPVVLVASDGLGRDWYRIDCTCGHAAVESMNAEQLRGRRCMTCSTNAEVTRA